MTGSALFNAGPGSRPRRELVPGAVHVPSWLTTGQQRWITERFDEWVRGPVPIRAAKVRGHEMSVRSAATASRFATVTSTVPAAPAGAVAAIVVGVSTMKLVAGVEPKFTAVTLVKPERLPASRPPRRDLRLLAAAAGAHPGGWAASCSSSARRISSASSVITAYKPGSAQPPCRMATMEMPSDVRCAANS